MMSFFREWLPLAKSDFRILALLADKGDFDAPTETLTTIMPLLYQSGYLTIKKYTPETDLYTLGIPNKEIRVGLFRNLFNGSAQEALEQIKSRGYADSFALDDLPVTKVGINFSLEGKKNITDWVIE